MFDWLAFQRFPEHESLMIFGAVLYAASIFVRRAGKSTGVTAGWPFAFGKEANAALRGMPTTRQAFEGTPGPIA